MSFENFVRRIGSGRRPFGHRPADIVEHAQPRDAGDARERFEPFARGDRIVEYQRRLDAIGAQLGRQFHVAVGIAAQRSEEHTSELQSLMRISYAVFCLKKKKTYPKERTLKKTNISTKDIQ